jgi:hypothetical protein
MLVPISNRIARILGNTRMPSMREPGHGRMGRAGVFGVDLDAGLDFVIERRFLPMDEQTVDNQ